MRLPQPFRDPRVVLPGILAIQGPAYQQGSDDVASFCRSFDTADPIRGFPLIVIVDDSEFTARSERNFLWVTFTRSDPAADIEGIGAFIDKKHWGCTGSLVIDARIKPHHAPPLVDDPEIERKVDALAAPGGPLHGVYYLLTNAIGAGVGQSFSPTTGPSGCVQFPGSDDPGSATQITNSQMFRKCDSPGFRAEDRGSWHRPRR